MTAFKMEILTDEVKNVILMDAFRDMPVIICFIILVSFDFGGSFFCPKTK
jgi:hypothetical protein